MKKLFDLTGRVAVVTGGAGHLGSGICAGLASCGAAVAIASRYVDPCCRAADELRAKYGTPTLGLRVDISSTSSVRDMFAQVEAEIGPTDVLVCNAAFSQMGRFESLDDERWERGIDGTINATARCIREAIEGMKARGRGSIITISSMYGIVAPDPSLYMDDESIANPACYGAGKAAVIALTRYIASYYGKYGIRANCVCPGPCPSPAVQDAHPDFVERLASRTMLGRIGRPDDMAGVVAFLVSDAAAFITGQTIAVDGGWTSR